VSWPSEPTRDERLRFALGELIELANSHGRELPGEPRALRLCLDLSMLLSCGRRRTALGRFNLRVRGARAKALDRRWQIWTCAYLLLPCSGRCIEGGVRRKLEREGRARLCLWPRRRSRFKRLATRASTFVRRQICFWIAFSRRAGGLVSCQGRMNAASCRERMRLRSRHCRHGDEGRYRAGSAWTGSQGGSTTCLAMDMVS